MRVDCPKCHLKVGVDLDSKKPFKFLLYRCTCCKSTVVYYDGKITIISDKLRKKLSRKYKLTSIKVCSAAQPNVITNEKIEELKILLETETDFDKLISKL